MGGKVVSFKISFKRPPLSVLYSISDVLSRTKNSAPDRDDKTALAHTKKFIFHSPTEMSSLFPIGNSNGGCGNPSDNCGEWVGVRSAWVWAKISRVIRKQKPEAIASGFVLCLEVKMTTLLF